MILFKGSLFSIMVTWNPDWSAEILWYGTGYSKKKYDHLLNVLPETGYIANFVINF
jgi:hypothetical protein